MIKPGRPTHRDVPRPHERSASSPFPPPAHSTAGAGELTRRGALAAAGAALLTAGCPRPTPDNGGFGTTSSDEEALPKLRLAVVDDVPLADAIIRQWTARASSELEILNLTAAELRERESLSTDAVIYPSGMLGELAKKRMVAPLDDDAMDDHALAQNDIFPLLRLRETNWGEKVYAVPLGSPVLSVLMQSEPGREPPSSWQQYAELAEAAAGENRPESWVAAAEPLGGHWAAEVLLARAAGYARRRDTLATLFDSQDMTPLIASPPFERALTELAAVARNAPQSLQWTPADAAAAVIEGRCGMTLSWLGPQQPAGEKAAPIIVGELPGSRDAYDRRRGEWVRRKTDNEGRVTLLGVAGRMGSVTRLAAYPREAFRMLALVCSGDWSRRIAPASAATAPFRKSHLANAEPWAPNFPELARQQAEVVERSLSRSDWLFSPRLAGRGEYLEALAERVRAAATDSQSPAEALADAAQAWREISERRGLDEQRQSYRESLVR